MEIRLPKELSLFFFWIFNLASGQKSEPLPSPKVAPHCADESWRVVENLPISCVLELHRAPRLQNSNSSFVRPKRLLICNHHLLEEAAHANEVVHDSQSGECAPEGAYCLFFWFFKRLRLGG
jgi:hypothetical protein